ncbi:MAG: hypothetical protein ACOY4Q_02465 [Bacillota bacterium]
MNKKLFAFLAPLAIGGVMLGASAYAAISGNSGYDVYKEAFKNTRAVQSMAPAVEVSVKDNGALLFEVESAAKVNRENRSMSGKFTIVSGGLTKTVDIYRQDGKAVFKSSDSDVYNVFEPGRGKKHRGGKWHGDDADRVQDIENLVDALAGDIRNFITLENNPDGSKEVALTLADNQISPVVNAAASLAVKKAGDGRGHMNEKHMAFMADSGLKDKLPKLVKDIKVSSIDVDAKITKDNLIEKQVQTIVITGVDADGKEHKLEITVEAGFTGYNSTVPDTVDLDGKQVNVIEGHKRGEDR